MTSTSVQRGLVNAITTPFTRANQLDEGAFVAHLEWLLENGIHHLLIGGTTGEFFSLTLRERMTLLDLASKHFSGSRMFHVGSDNLTDTIHLARYGENNGAHSIATLPPYYLAGVEEDALIRYLCEVGDAADLPFLIYNFPRHTQNPLTPAVLQRVPHAALKDSAADMSLIEYTPAYFIGSDKKLLQSHSAGGAGFISARSNCEPELYARLDAAIDQNKMEEATILHADVLRTADRLSGPRQIGLVKTEISRALPGYPARVRLPLLSP